MPAFNESQKAAIKARNQNILVSAAAGSGKTTVMVEKIKETLIAHPEASISQFLVITFTKEAAQNMKDKLRRLLEEAAEGGNDPAARALGEIETATISTIHSFCTQLLKEYNDDAGASMNPRVLSDGEKKKIFSECFQDAGNIVLSAGSPYSREERRDANALMSAFSMEEIGKMVQDLYNVLMGIPEPMDFLARVVDELPCEQWNREIMTSIWLDLLGLEEALQREAELMALPEALAAYAETVQNDAELADAFLQAFRQAGTEEEKRELLASAKAGFRKAPVLRGLDGEAKAWKEEMDGVRDGIKGSKGVFAAAIKRMDAMLDERNGRLNAIIQQELRGLAVLLRATAELYKRQKLEAGTIDYADMEQIAYQIMKNDEKREELLDRYKYIYVDECQDVSGIQKAIITKFIEEGHRLFMVGDIKQSIYGFRHAEPALFEKDREEYSDDEGEDNRRIFFMDNYRSCRNVVDAVNEVFTEAMEDTITEINYEAEDRLRCNRDGGDGPVDVILVQKGEEEADKLEAQCEAAGRYIQSLIASAGEAGGKARYQYRDIVILISVAKGTASTIVDHLKKMHIPAMFTGAPDFFGLAEVKAFLSLLTVIDNYHHDDALVGTMINAPFLFTESELAEIRLAGAAETHFWKAFKGCADRNETQLDQKCRQLFDQLAAWRKVSEGMPAPDFIWWLMRETGIYAARGAYPDGKARQANLDALYQRALDGMKAGNMRLSDFVNDLQQARETKLGDSDAPPALGADDNFVRVMTMHKSKGLEFPVVILMDLQKSIRGKRSDEKLRINISTADDGDSSLGLYLPAVQRNRNSIMDSQGREAFDIRALRKNIAERTRLLYVAMTRAMQKLCLIGSVKDGEERLWMSRTKAARIWKTRSMLDMIMPAVLKRVGMPETGESREDGLWRLSCISGKAIADSGEAADTADGRIEEALAGAGEMDLYLPEKAEPAPLKTSVTTLARQARVLSEDDSEETVEDKRRTEEAVRTFRLSTAATRPAFLEEEKAEAVNIGTITHRFIRLINLESLRGEEADMDKAIREEARRMEEEGILTEEEAKQIRLQGVADFFRSNLGRRMLNSSEIEREAEFTMRMDAHSATMVQGIVDCAFRENGEWILIDYKTDHDTNPETFIPRHEIQMNWYRTALERLTGTGVREMWLFALRNGKAYPVPRKAVGTGPFSEK